MGMRISPAIRRLAAMAIAFACFSLAPRADAQGRCGAGVDLVVQALEKMRADASTDELEDADQLLKRAAELCGELGDAWYYRSLVERKLGHAALADFAMRHNGSAVLSNANSYSGATQVNGGVLQLSNTAAIANSSSLTFTGGTLALVSDTSGHLQPQRRKHYDRHPIIPRNPWRSASGRKRQYP